MNYVELKEKHAKEFGELPIFFAFNSKQFQEGLNKLGALKEDGIQHIGGGGFMNKKDIPLLSELLARHEEESTAAMKDDTFMLNAIEYELGNHEYIITYDDEETLSVLGLSLADPRVNRLFIEARRKYLNFFCETA